MKSRLSPILWSGLVMAASLALTLYVAVYEKPFFETNQIISPEVSLAPVTLYFFGVVVVMAVILFLIPLRWLKYVFRILFTLMFAWGMFWVVLMRFPALEVIAYAAAAVAGLAWLFWARIWLHDLLLLIALAGAGSVFGFLFSPWTFMIFTLIIAVYDVLAVRFGLMVWMADRLSQSASLPAFIFPRQIKDWRLSLDAVRFGELKEQAPAEREYAVLGGGDIGFPLMLSVSVYFQTHLAGGLVVGIFALAGVVSAFLIQASWLRGKPMPALPPIALFSFIGFLIAMYLLG
jgi:presenilin-like A22 family membrane protease